MTEGQSLLEQLKEIIHWKKTKAFYAERFGITEDEVTNLLRTLRGKEISPKEIIKEYIEFKEGTRKVNVEKGTIESTITSDFEPKDDIELAELHKINLDKYVITNYWSKILPNGKFTSSVFSKLISDDDIIRKDLTEDIREIFSTIEKNSG